MKIAKSQSRLKRMKIAKSQRQLKKTTKKKTIQKQMPMTIPKMKSVKTKKIHKLTKIYLSRFLHKKLINECESALKTNCRAYFFCFSPVRMLVFIKIAGIF